MELLECCVCLMSIEEGVGVLGRLGGEEKYDDKVGRGEDNYYCSISEG